MKQAFFIAAIISFGLGAIYGSTLRFDIATYLMTIACFLRISGLEVEHKIR